MKRIVIFGGVGAGKTTFARQLSKRLKIPLYSTDELIYSKTGKEVCEGSKERNSLNVAGKNKWIVEGVHLGDWLVPVFKRADTIILLDIKRTTLLRQVLKRYKQSKGKPHGKLISLWNCLRWAYGYKSSDYLSKKSFVDEEKFIVLKNNKEAAYFFKSL